MIPRQVKIGAAVLMASAILLALYTWNLKRKAEHSLEQAIIPVAPAAAGTTSTVTLYVASDSEGQLTRKSVSIPLPDETTERTQQIIRNLLVLYQSQSSPHAIGAGADIENVFFVNNSLAVLNFNGAFAEKHPSGILAEELTVASIVATLRANSPQVEKVKFLVDGRERETLAGHADIKNPLNAIAVTQMAKDLP